MSKESPVSAGNDAYVDLDRQVPGFTLFLYVRRLKGKLWMLMKRVFQLLKYIGVILYFLPNMQELHFFFFKATFLLLLLLSRFSRVQLCATP